MRMQFVICDNLVVITSFVVLQISSSNHLKPSPSPYLYKKMDVCTAY